MRILSEPHRDRAMLIASVNRKLNADLLSFMEPFGKLFQVLQFSSKPTINFAVLTYYKAISLAQPLPDDTPVISNLKEEFIALMDRSFFEASLKAHQWLGSFLDPDFKRFEFLPAETRGDLAFKTTLLQDIDKWALEHMEDTFTLEHQGDNLQPSAKRPRNGATFETSYPFSDLRDSAVDKNGGVQSISPDKQIL